VAQTFARVINNDLTNAEAAYANATNQEERDAAHVEVQRQKAALVAIHENLASAKQGVSEALGNEIFGQVVRREREVVEQTVQVPVEVQVPTGLTDAAGQPIMRTEQQIETQVQTVPTGRMIPVNRIEELQENATDPIYQQYKREYREAVRRGLTEQQAAEAAEAARRAAQAGMQPPGAGPQPGGPGPGGPQPGGPRL
jgi:hypothetical protein